MFKYLFHQTQFSGYDYLPVRCWNLEGVEWLEFSLWTPSEFYSMYFLLAILSQN